MKYVVFLTFVFNIFYSHSQVNLNSYKYIVVPKKFDGFKKENQHQTSTTVKYYLIEKGFNAIYEDALPDDLAENRCLGLQAELNDTSTLFSTKVNLVLKDCNNQEVFITQEGKSKIKEYKAAYSDAIKRAFESFNGIAYEYEPQDNSDKPITVSFKNDVKQLETEQKSKELDKYQDPMEKREPAPREEILKTTEPVEPNIDKPNFMVENTEELSSTLYAQAIPNGYQLVDKEPKIKFRIFKSSISDFYHAKSMDNTVNGIIFNKVGKWIFEYYEEGNLKIEELNIKF